MKTKKLKKRGHGNGSSSTVDKCFIGGFVYVGTQAVAKVLSRNGGFSFALFLLRLIAITKQLQKIVRVL